MTPLTYTVEQVAEVLQIGRTAAYEAVKRGEIPSIRIGRSLRVPRHRLTAMLDPEDDNGPAARGAEVKTPGEHPRHGAV